ncbi:MAG: YjjG family noncanonical pyrimidine nucleotidase [bacterium]|nr:YjjG family noncanonical pyrimidine nucleotidase [bacterium]
MAQLKYQHIFFDLDHTLWDYDANARESLEELFDKYRFTGDHFSKDELVSTFFEVNYQLWDDYNHNRIDKKYIRTERFKIIFDRLKLPLSDFPYGFADDYLYLCPTKSHKIPHADEILNYLSGKYSMHIITNGFNDIQNTKLKSSGLSPFFQEVITSESIGARKPSPTIFDHALEKAGASKEGSVMIGDNLDTDIMGARDFGMDHIYFNPSNPSQNHRVTHEVTSLIELKDIL